MVVYKKYHTWQVARCGRKITHILHSNSMTCPNVRTRYANRDYAISAAHCLECSVTQVDDSAHLNSMGNWIPLTNCSCTLGGYPGPPVMGRRAGGLDGEVDCSTALVKGHFDQFHNHNPNPNTSYQIADLFNRRNVTSLNHKLPEVASVKSTYLATAVSILHGSDKKPWFLVAVWFPSQYYMLISVAF